MAAVKRRAEEANAMVTKLSATNQVKNIIVFLQ